MKRLITRDEYFNFYVPLSMLFGFCEDYKHVVINARHELILVRERNDNNCIVGSNNRAEIWIIQDTVANASRYVKWNQ